MKLLENRKIQIAVIILAVLLAYSNIFQNTFVGDDETFIVKWDLTKSIDNFPKVFTNQSVPPGHEGGYRPIRTLFLMLSYQLWGLNPLGYHLLALTAHLISTILVFLIVSHLGKLGKLTPFAAALLFGLHPIHTESVTFMTSSFDTIGFMFYLGAFALYILAKRNLSILLAALAYFTNELTLTLPLVIIWYEICLRKASHSGLFRKILPFFIPLLFYLFVRMGLLNIVGRGEYLAGSFYLTLLTMIKTLVKYLELLTFPVNLSINHLISPGIQSLINTYTININQEKLLSQKIYDLDILFSITIIIIITITMVIARKKAPVITFAAGWFFLTLLPVSNILPIGTILQERYLYIPSLGFILLIVSLLNNKRIVILFHCFIVGLAIFLGFLTYQRNFDWKDNIAMWTKLSTQLPNDVPTYLYLASLHLNNNQEDLALGYYQKVLSIAPDLPFALERINKIKSYLQLTY